MQFLPFIHPWSLKNIFLKLRHFQSVITPTERTKQVALLWKRTVTERCKNSYERYTIRKKGYSQSLSRALGTEDVIENIVEELLELAGSRSCCLGVLGVDVTLDAFEVDRVVIEDFAHGGRGGDVGAGTSDEIDEWTENLERCMISIVSMYEYGLDSRNCSVSLNMGCFVPNLVHLSLNSTLPHFR
jgi:hypothetical protein